MRCKKAQPDQALKTAVRNSLGSFLKSLHKAKRQQMAGYLIKKYHTYFERVKRCICLEAVAFAERHEASHCRDVDEAHK
jgi:hypothetical protein